MTCQSRSTSKRSQRVDQGNRAPVFPGFTVIQLNHLKEHPRGYELSLEKESVTISYGALIWKFFIPPLYLIFANWITFPSSIVISNDTFLLCEGHEQVYSDIKGTLDWVHQQVIPRATKASTSCLRNISPVDISPCIRECTCSMPAIKLKGSRWDIKDAAGQLWGPTHSIVWSL